MEQHLASYHQDSSWLLAIHRQQYTHCFTSCLKQLEGLWEVRVFCVRHKVHNLTRGVLSLPEIDTDFDDSNFTAADLTTTNVRFLSFTLSISNSIIKQYTNLPPLPGMEYVLYAQQYG